ncbi:scaffoldin [Piromyces finnis]|uniref:Scaffoldin n=1 Tax=Piromyces finnis TaxID=1754191 RepID=A0A1Y1V115_9FUNG|nr:scaffoldin [Piromyces finnis]|eukprot:ORX44894.1 scaffoldin [Piromyces finnis]
MKLKRIISIFILIFSLFILKVKSDGLVECAKCHEGHNDQAECDGNKYCYDDTTKTIKSVTAKIEGSVEFGKSGKPSGNFFFNGGKLVTNESDGDNIDIGYICNSSGCNEISLETDDEETYINSKAASLSCAYILVAATFKCKNGSSTQSFFDTTSKKVFSCSSSRCTSTTSAAGYYVDYADYGDDFKGLRLINCNGNSCEVNTITDEEDNRKIEFYLNSGSDKSSMPIIYFDKEKYKTITGDTTVAYLDNGTYRDNYYNNLIICTSITKCSSVAHDSGIFLSPANSASVNDSTNINQLIECSSSGCAELDDTEIMEYIGSNSENSFYIDEISKNLISCMVDNIDDDNKVLKCRISNKEISNKYYLDYSTFSLSENCDTVKHIMTIETDEESFWTFCGINIISCDSLSKCKSSNISEDSNFIDGDTGNNLIVCTTFGSDFFCAVLGVEALGLSNYYINSGNSGIYPLLYCNGNKKCVEKKANTNGYYITDTSEKIKESPLEIDNSGYLIHCNSETKCEKLLDVANDGYYVNVGSVDTTKPLIYYNSESSEFEEKETVANTYYLDSSSLASGTYSNLIYCSSTKNCTSIIPNDGYYINAPGEDETNIIIKCDKTGCKTGESTNESIQNCIVDNSMTLYVGNYCIGRESNDIETKDLNFVVNDFVIDNEPIDSVNKNITYVSSSANYYYVTVLANNFPGISTTVTTLFQVKSNSISRVVDDAVYIINSRNEKVESISGSVSIGNSYSIYTCSSTTKLCIQETSCPSGTYFFDEDNGKGYLCSEKSIMPITDEGYYVDGGYVVNKSLTPAVLKCNESGNCQRFIPTNTYFINAGIDNDKKALIHCSNDQCMTEEAAIGYYRAEFGESGIIVCTSNTNCKISSLQYNYYINSGADNSVKPIIACNKNIYCNTKKAVSGYYLVQENSNLLINCKSGISCEAEDASVGYYYNSANNDNNSSVETVIKCVTSSFLNSVVCTTEKKNVGFYVSGAENNILINCIGGKCKSIVVDNGIFRSAATIKTTVSNSSRDKYDEEEEMNLIEHAGRSDEEIIEIEKESNVMLGMSEKTLYSRATSGDESVSTLISCNGGVCKELTAEELMSIPICSYNNEFCYLDNSNYITSSNKNNLVSSVNAGEFCTDKSRSTIYFALDTIVEYKDVISGVLSSSSTSSKNCIKASSQYASNLFTIGNNIYQVNDGFIKEVYDSGYYFINVKKNILVYGNEIKEYNDNNVRLYKCYDRGCRIMEKPSSNTFYTDVTKRIIKYTVEDNKYSFVNKKENTCTFENNTCTPKYDIGENDFCMTAEGNIVVAGEKIKSRETGRCYMSNSISENVLAFSYNSVLYLLNSNAANQVITSGYYFAENNKYNSAEYKTFNTTSSGITLYGCINQNCKIYQPQPDIYYFDMLTNYLIQKKNDEWISPIKVGHLLVSINPEEVYIYSYTMSDSKELLLTKTNKNGYYYTIDRKMYNCDTSMKACKEIDDTAYILTNSNELYYCLVDSEGEETECTKKICTTGQIYYIKNDYYKCTTGSFFELIRSRNCDYDETVVINFPVIYADSFPVNVYDSISNIAEKNHYVPTKKTSRQSIESYQGVFTNCTYDVYKEDTTYDQICMQNYVKLNQDKEPDICSIEHLGYTYCTVEDGDNKDKCSPSGVNTQKSLSILKLLTLILSTIIILITY